MTPDETHLPGLCGGVSGQNENKTMKSPTEILRSKLLECCWCYPDANDYTVQDGHIYYRGKRMTEHDILANGKTFTKAVRESGL